MRFTTIAKMNYSKKTKRQLRAIIHNNNPWSTRRAMDPILATQRHRSAYWELMRRLETRLD